MAITTVAAWKARRGIAETTWDAIVPNLIDGVQSYMERYCSRKFETATYTDEAYDGDGSDEIHLRNWPVTAVDAVKILSSDGTTTTLDSGDYRADLSTDNTGRVVRVRSSVGYWDDYPASVWPCGKLNIQVTYDGGYATIPHDLEEAAFCLIDARLAGTGVNIFEQARAEGNESRTFRTAADATEYAHFLLAPYRRLP